jgi:hypothetical protein
MSVSKREWNPRLTVEDAVGVALGWLRRAAEMNVITREPPTLYQAYLLEEAPSLALFKDLGGLFRYSAKDDPELHRARDKALRLLSVALKAHFFLGRSMEARHEPYLFSFPDLSNASRPHYGLIHRLDSVEPSVRPVAGSSSRPKSRTVVVSTADLSAVSSEFARATRFPVVLPEDAASWIDLARWSALAQQGDTLDRQMRSFKAKREEEAAIAAVSDPAQFSAYGTLLEVPYELKDVMKGTGIQYAPGLRRWYLPLGHDVKAVGEYLAWVQDLHQRSPEAFEARFWRELPRKASGAPARPQGGQGQGGSSAGAASGSGSSGAPAQTAGAGGFGAQNRSASSPSPSAPPKGAYPRQWGRRQNDEQKTN